MGEGPLQGRPPHGDLPAVLATKTVQEGGRGSQDVDSQVGSQCSRELFRRPARPPFRLRVVAVGTGADAEAAVGWGARGPADADLLVGEAEGVVPERVTHRVVAGAVG